MRNIEMIAHKIILNMCILPCCATGQFNATQFCAHRNKIQRRQIEESHGNFGWVRVQAQLKLQQQCSRSSKIKTC